MTPATLRLHEVQPEKAEEQTESRSEIIHQRLMYLYEKTGRLATDDIIKDARKPTSPLHDEFDWNVDSAAYQYWTIQARKLIVMHWERIRTEKITFDAPYFIRDPNAEQGEQGYVPIASLAKEPELSFKAFRVEVSKAQSYLERARVMAQTLNVELELERTIVVVESLLTLAEKHSKK